MLIAIPASVHKMFKPESDVGLTPFSWQGDLSTLVDRDHSGRLDTDEELMLAVAVRPMLRVLDGRIAQAPTARWQKYIEQRQSSIVSAAASIGKIEGRRADGTWILFGTGWVCAERCIVTNHHVRMDLTRLGVSAARIDFANDGAGTSKRIPLDLRSARSVPDDDVCVLRAGVDTPPPLQITDSEVRDATEVVAIGFPSHSQGARERPTPKELVERLLGTNQNPKFVSPGNAWLREGDVWHDCTTLAGNSGSPLYLPEKKLVVGLHRGGPFSEANLDPGGSNRERLRANLATRAERLRAALKSVT
jgi:hypothetical protein